MNTTHQLYRAPARAVERSSGSCEDRARTSTAAHRPKETTQTWLKNAFFIQTGRTYAIWFPSGEKTQASGRGAVASSARSVSRDVSPVSASVAQTLLSMT